MTDKTHELLRYGRGSRVLFCRRCPFESDDLTEVARHAVANQWSVTERVRLGVGRDQEQGRR